MNCVPLMSARPSFAASTIGARPTARSASSPGQRTPVDRRLPLADQRQRKVRQRREVAARPDGAARRHVRHEARAEHRDEQLDRLDAGARVTLCERVRTQEHRRAHDVVGVRIADAAGMAAQQPQLQLGRLLGRDRLRDEPAEAGVDAVRVVADLRLEERARRSRPLAAASSQRNVSAPDRDVPDVPDREVVTRELDHGRHGASLVPPRAASRLRALRAGDIGRDDGRTPGMGERRPLKSRYS